MQFAANLHVLIQDYDGIERQAADLDGLLIDDDAVAPFGTREVGIREVGTREVGTREVGTREVGIREVGLREVGLREVGVREAGALNVLTLAYCVLPCVLKAMAAASLYVLVIRPSNPESSP